MSHSSVREQVRILYLELLKYGSAEQKMLEYIQKQRFAISCGSLKTPEKDYDLLAQQLLGNLASLQ